MDLLPSNLWDYAFGSGPRSGIAILGNATNGFEALSRPLRLSETYDAIEACLNEELEGGSPDARQRRALNIRRLWEQLDDPEVLKSIFSLHRRLYFEWRRGAEIDEVGQFVVDGAIEAIDNLLAEGRSVNPKAGAAPPLSIAADDGNEAMTIALLERGALIDALDARQRSPLRIAAERGADRVVSALLAAGANATLADSDGKTPLIIAAERGHAETVRTLIPISKCLHRDGSGRSASGAARDKWPELADEIEARALALSGRAALSDFAAATPPSHCARNFL